MPKRIFHPNIYRNDESVLAQFVDGMRDAATKDGVTLDSAAANEFVGEVTHGREKLPMGEKLQSVYDDAGEYASHVTQAIMDSANAYEVQHGMALPADVLNQAVHNAWTGTRYAKSKYSLDSAVTTSAHHNPDSIQPSRLVVSILSTIGEAIPFANYIPADPGTNEAKIAIVSNRAGTTYGGYTQNGEMDGTLSGDRYIYTSRIQKGATTDGAAFTGKLTVIQSDPDNCDPQAVVPKLLRGASIVYINGRPAAREVDSEGSGDSPITGKIDIAGVSYQVSGTINTDTAEFTVAVAPALPVAFRQNLVVEAHIDYERDSKVIPEMLTVVQTHSQFARVWQGRTRVTMSGRTQMSNELGLDPYSQQIMALNAQVANERYRHVLHQARRLGVNNVGQANFDWSGQKSAKDRAQIWADTVMPELARMSQQMAEDTLSHGISHLFVEKHIGAEMRGLPRDLFVPSGVSGRAGIHRIGTLGGLYEVYYDPHSVTGSAFSAEIRCIGRAADTARNVFQLGDAVPPTMIPLAVDQSLDSGAGFYARSFTEVNKYEKSAKGCATLNITNRA